MKTNKKTSGNEIIKSVLFLLAIMIISIGATKIFYTTMTELSTISVKDINATFGVANKLGFAADKDVLNFGVIPPGASSTKKIIITNDFNNTVKIKVVYFGNISKVLSSVDDFKLQPKESKNVTITAYAITKNNSSFRGIVRILFMKT